MLNFIYKNYDLSLKIRIQLKGRTSGPRRPYTALRRQVIRHPWDSGRALFMIQSITNLVHADIAGLKVAMKDRQLGNGLFRKSLNTS